MKKLISLLLIVAVSVNANAVYYYLHDDVNQYYQDAKLMDEIPPTSAYVSYANIDEQPVIWATIPTETDLKISGDVAIYFSIEAYTKLNFIPFQLRIIKVYLIDISPSGNIDIIDSTSPQTILFLGNNTVKTQTTYFNNVEYMLPSNHLLGIKIEKVVDLLSYFPLNILSTFFDTNIFYDSTNAKSYASIPVNLTGGGINIECWNQEKSTKPGKNATYTLYIYNSAYENDIVRVFTEYSNDWIIEINPRELLVEGNSWNISYVTVTPPGDAKEGDYLNLTIMANGSIGSDWVWLNTSVVGFEYGVDVGFKQKNIEASPGENLTIPFYVKNTGDLKDKYSLKVISNWSYNIEKEEITLMPGENTTINLSIEVPKNAKESEIIEIEASSLNSKDSDYTTISIFLPPPEESRGNIIGLILLIIFVVILLLIAYYIGRETSKTAIITCDDRSVETVPGKKAKFSLLIQNPLKKGKMKYGIFLEGKIPEKWKIDVDKEAVVLDSGGKEEVKVTVAVPKDEKINEWASIDFVVVPEKGRKEKINLLVTLREEMPVLKTEIFHEPKEFVEGEKILTKVRIENSGEKIAENKRVTLLVNGKEKNRIEGIDIPPNSIVEVEIPWIAEKENNVEIKIE